MMQHRSMTTIVLSICILPFLVCCGENTEKLQAEMIDDNDGGGGGIDDYDSSGDIDDNDSNKDNGETEYHDIFSLEKGDRVMLRSYTGGVDPIGTSIVDDFDGDGITNDKETINNVWVADYPNISAVIETPVTMKIEMEYTRESIVKEFSSQITASDVDSITDMSNDLAHKNEVNLRTVQYQDSYNTASSSETDREVDVNVTAAVNVFACGGSTTVGVKTRTRDAASKSYGETKTKWKDVPFKNDVQSQAWSLKRSNAAQLSRRTRNEIRKETTENYKIKANAGVVRASMSITNNTVNMPVRISNILCSLMFEKPDGSLIPVKSFYLRKDNYEDFSVEIGGGDTVSGYVIELAGLNTYEINEAITKGYNPRLYIIDYKMTHVDDSIYRQALSSNFTGDNLKMIEENAKGRTAGIKLVGPGFREFFRVVAFDTDANESRTTQSNEVTTITTGVSLDKALKRIAFSGYAYETANYVYDFSELRNIPPVFVKSIYSVNGIANTIPCVNADNPIIEADGSKTYIVKPVSEWTDDEIKHFRVWAVYADGRYYAHTEDELDSNGNPVDYTYTVNGKPYTAYKTKGIDSTIWAGDHYDIVCLDFWEFMQQQREFGNNPFETGETITFNTRWSLQEVGRYYFDPDVKSVYLGDALPGEEIKLTFRLKANRSLNPVFGITETSAGYLRIGQFSYTPSESSKRLTIDEALEFEINFGQDGRYSSWINLRPLNRSQFSDLYLDYVNNTSTTEPPFESPQMLTTSWDFLNQAFTVRIRVPQYMDGVDVEDDLVGVYLRPALNNAFRESVWPLAAEDVKRFRGITKTLSTAETFVVKVQYGTGTIETGDTLVLALDETLDAYTVESVEQGSEADGYLVTLTAPLTKDYPSGIQAYVDFPAPLTNQEVLIHIDDGFENDWNSDWVANQCFAVSGQWDWEHTDGTMPLYAPGDALETYSPVQKHLGFDNSYLVANWLGEWNYNYPICNSWSDSSHHDDFFDPKIWPRTSTGTAMTLMARDTNGDPVPLPEHGMANFMVAPLIEREFDLTAEVVIEY